MGLVNVDQIPSLSLEGAIRDFKVTRKEGQQYVEFKITTPITSEQLRHLSMLTSTFLTIELTETQEAYRLRIKAIPQQTRFGLGDNLTGPLDGIEDEALA